MKRIKEMVLPMNKYNFCALLCMLCALILAGCTDDLFMSNGRNEAVDGIQFEISTQEMGDLMIGIGSTRALPISPESREADAFTARDMEGDNPYGLSLHRMPLPFVGIHSKAVHASSGSETRASVDDIVNGKDDFHDSLSIWGYAKTVKGDKKKLFSENGTLLKRIQNWRSAVLWPYDKNAEDPYYMMRFYAIAPSVENLNFKLDDNKKPSYDNAPVFTLTLPESVAAMRDVLYGESDIISVQAGPSPNGSVTDDQEQESIERDNKKVSLTFSHIMTAIRFAQGNGFPCNDVDNGVDNGVVIKKIRLKNIHVSGKFDPNETDVYTRTKGKWSLDDGSVKYTYELTNLSTNTSGNNTYIDGQQVLFMIPQTLNGEEELEVELEAPIRFKTNENGNYIFDSDGKRIPLTETKTKTHVVSCKLTGDVWKKGYTVTYKLTIGELEDGYYLLVDAPEALEHNSESKMSGTFTVHSYRSYYDYSKDPSGKEDKSHGVNWKIVGYAESKDNAENNKFIDDIIDDIIDGRPDWLLDMNGQMPSKGAIYGGGYNSTVSFTVDTAKYTYYYKNKFKYKQDIKILTHSGVLKANSNPEANGDDLSALKTANCYVVNRTGTYKFPLVYGNGKITGADFVDHRGEIISSESIKEHISSQYEGKYNWTENGLRAQIIWQDVKGLAKPLSVLASQEMLQFSVNEATPGNAVIALQALPIDGTDWETLWTWHIWMTDEVYQNSSTDGVSYDSYYLTYNSDTNDRIVSLENSNKILPVNLGWVPDKDAFGVYEPREVWVKIQQTEGKDGNNASVVFCIKQHARQDLITGTSTIYQWGRPTALPMTLYSDGTNTKKRDIYDGEGNIISDRFTLEQASELLGGYHIANPYNMFRWSEETDDKNNLDGKSVWFDMKVASVPEYWKAGAGKKTVYDPCPPGFQVPSVDIFKVLSRKNSDSPNGSDLNIYPDKEYTDANGNSGTAASASPNAGGYFYTKPISDIDKERYSPLVYFPVTGEWQGDVPAGTVMNSTYIDEKGEVKYLKINNTFGFYWCADNNPTDKINASTLWIHPEWNYNRSDKPAIQFGRTIQYSSAQPIRPTKSKTE